MTWESVKTPLWQASVFCKNKVVLCFIGENCKMNLRRWRSVYSFSFQYKKNIYVRLKVQMTQVFISLFERAFKMMKNGVDLIVIALLVAELFKILIYAN